MCVVCSSSGSGAGAAYGPAFGKGCFFLRVSGASCRCGYLPLLLLGSLLRSCASGGLAALSRADAALSAAACWLQGCCCALAASVAFVVAVLAAVSAAVLAVMASAFAVSPLPGRSRRLLRRSPHWFPPSRRRLGQFRGGRLCAAPAPLFDVAASAALLGASRWLRQLLRCRCA